MLYRILPPRIGMIRDIIVNQVLLDFSTIKTEPLFQLEDFGIYQEAIREALEKMPNKAFFTIQETCLQYITDGKIDERS